MKKRILAVLMALSLAGSALALAGCGSENGEKTDTTGSADEKGDADSSSSDGGEEEITHIKFMGWGTDAEISTFEKMLAGFEEKYPNIKVEYTTVPSGDFDTKLQNRNAHPGRGTAYL